VDQGKQLATPHQETSGGLWSFLFPPPLAPSVRDQTQILTDDLQILGPQEAYIKRSTDPPVKIRTLAVPDTAPPASEITTVLATYRRRYQRPQEAAEDQIARLERMQTLPADSMPAFQSLFAGDVEI
jgi:hypothetical protein